MTKTKTISAAKRPYVAVFHNDKGAVVKRNAGSNPRRLLNTSKAALENGTYEGAVSFDIITRSNGRIRQSMELKNGKVVARLLGVNEPETPAIEVVPSTVDTILVGGVPCGFVLGKNQATATLVFIADGDLSVMGCRPSAINKEVAKYFALKNAKKAA